MTLQNSLNTLQNAGVILFPSDTVLGLGCDATNTNAVGKIFSIKKRNQSKSLVALVSSFQMLEDYVEVIPTEVFEILEQTSVPTTIVYPKAKEIAPMAMADDGSMAFRIPNSGFTHDLVRSFGKPIIATSANISGDPIPEKSSQVSKSILEQVDYVVPLKSAPYSVTPSKIIKVTSDGKIKIIRP